MSQAQKKSSAEDTPIIIKKYANRRLYNTQTSVYITLDDVRTMVKEGASFVVRDAKTGEDLTRQILTQIIFEQEMSGPHSVLPIGFLKRVIEMYDDSLSEMIPHYLESSMESFVTNQEKIREYVNRTWTQYNPMSQLEEISRKNVEMYSQVFSMFNPFEAFFAKEKDDSRK